MQLGRHEMQGYGTAPDEIAGSNASSACRAEKLPRHLLDRAEIELAGEDQQIRGNGPRQGDGRGRNRDGGSDRQTMGEPEDDGAAERMADEDGFGGPDAARAIQEIENALRAGVGAGIGERFAAAAMAGQIEQVDAPAGGRERLAERLHDRRTGRKAVEEESGAAGRGAPRLDDARWCAAGVAEDDPLLGGARHG